MGARAAEPSTLVTNFRPQAEPVPVRMSDRLCPLCQSARLMTACTTGAISSSPYQVLACHDTLELCATDCVVSGRCPGGLLAEKVGLSPAASAARLMLRFTHCDWLEYTCSRAEVIVAPGGMARFVKRSPV